MYETTSRSAPITFVARRGDPEDEDDYEIERETPDEERESESERLTNTEWFDEEVGNLGPRNFLEHCGLLEEVQEHGAVRATVLLVSKYMNSPNGIDWDLDIDVVELSPLSPEWIIREALRVARDVAARSRPREHQSYDREEYVQVSEILQAVGCLDEDRDQDLELRNAIAEGMIEALSGLPYLDDYGDEPHGTRLALAYCGGFCLAAPGYGHAQTVRDILDGVDERTGAGAG